MTTFTRRTVVRGVGGTFAVGFLAGCLGDDEDDDQEEDDPETVAVNWASAADNFDDAGDIEDHTGEDSVTVLNGEQPGANYVFEPAVVRIDAGTEVVWEWTTNNHTVDLIPGEGATLTDWDDHPQAENEGYEYATTFDEPGVALYECVPHRAQNQRGAGIVE